MDNILKNFNLINNIIKKNILKKFYLLNNIKSIFLKIRENIKLKSILSLF